jgi:hypothetical protein
MAELQNFKTELANDFLHQYHQAFHDVKLFFCRGEKMQAD